MKLNNKGRVGEWIVIIAVGAFILIGIICGFATAFSRQGQSRYFGGDSVITLEPGEKLEEITWKDDELWYVVRPMREDEFAETHTFKQTTPLGILEGTVTIIEQDVDKEEQ